MAAKCALVVDDSKSARAFLSRILEKHLLDVDCVGSAEEAIDYLTRHRPDVIFMDHLMPGMDGFQAVQAIKANPRTATIPILMYTSQEGELYLGQARALGALGVLPKQIRPADVTQVLLQLHLFKERRSPHTYVDAGPNDATQISPAIGASTANTPLLPPELQSAAALPPPGVADVPNAATAAATGRYAFGSPVEQLLRDQIAEVRRTLVARIDELQEALPSQLHQIARADLPPPAPAPPPPPPQADRRGWAAAAVIAALALLLAVLLGREHGQRVATDRNLAALLERERALDAGRAAAADVPAAADATPEAARTEGRATPVRVRLPGPPLAFSVPFGETPLAGDRVSAVRSALEELRRSGLNGEVELQVHQGRFCLVGNAGEGYSLAPDDLAVSRCDRMGNANLDGGANLPSLPFANMLAEQRKAAGNALNIRMAADVPDRPVQPYPDAGSMPVAGVWNASAAANNRIELRWRERP